MATSTPFYTCLLHDRVIAPKSIKCNKDYLTCNYQNLVSKQWIHSKSFPVSGGLRQSRQSERLLTRNGIRCSALGIENMPLVSLGKKFELDDVIEAQQFDREILSAIFEVAREMEKIEKNSLGSQILKGYLMATLFYEPSTRTRLSFESAMKRLGGEVLTTENAREFSSAAKGETLEGNCLSFINFRWVKGGT